MLLGTLYIIAAPSGAGKTSLVQTIVKQMTQLTVSISHVTRAPRANEVNGNHYYFIDEKTFQAMIKTKQFLEHAEVFGYHYGTSRAWVMTQLERGNDVILEIDWQGAQQIRQQFEHTISIFIMPPSLEILQQRLETRRGDSQAVITERMRQARQEISHYAEFDYLIVNDAFDQAIDDLTAIINAERLRVTPQKVRQAKLLENIFNDIIGFCR